ncbi:putative recombinase [Planobispora takensis]|uniref:Putative recombinase n=1 Tax=Planobispora takensis TaxID=1367882 RepID=A0A8J3WQU3_9ACTN|nr:putative recombinase [Planobispora takensis]
MSGWGAAAEDPFDGLRVAWCGRTSTEDLQDPTLSLPRQLDNSRAALPPGSLIVAHFYDIESGRKNLEDRGYGTAHERFDIAIPRDGGIQGLLSEAGSRDRRFDAVICESIDRISRRTFYGTKIEHELEQLGIPLFAADEPITLNGKRATAILTRRVKQGIAEWYAVQMMEASWDGLRTHTQQGWNVGRPPYGYRAQKVAHPVPAKAADGKHKTKLVPDPVRGPVITQIFMWRVMERLGYGDIADRLNADHERYPPPESLNPNFQGRNAWSRSGIREMLLNPKYTGHMVWNRKATTSRRGSGRSMVNPPSAWVWSEHPTHEPLITREMYEAAQGVGKERATSRTGSDANAHPQTCHTYLLRSFVHCDLCDRRMFGQTEMRRKAQYSYYCCQPSINHKGREDRFPGHPKVVRVREDSLADAVHDLFQRRVFGPDRHALLAADLPATAHRAEDEWEARCKALKKGVAEITRKQDRLIAQIEDSDGDAEFARRLRARFAELETDRRTRAEQLAEAEANPPARDHRTGLLDMIPMLSARLADLPEDLRRELFAAFHLEVRYNDRTGVALLRITIEEDTVKEAADMAGRLADQPGKENRHPLEADACAEDLRRAPGMIRTCDTRFRRAVLYPLSYGGRDCM